MALAAWKSGRMKNAKTKCAHRTKQGKMALLHCLTRDLIFHSWCKFPTATADFTSHNARAIYFVFFFSFRLVFFLLLCMWTMPVCIGCVHIYEDFGVFGWLLRILSANNKLGRHFRLGCSLFCLRPCLCRYQCFSDFCTYHRLCGGLSSFSDCQILVES